MSVPTAWILAGFVLLGGASRGVAIPSASEEGASAGSDPTLRIVAPPVVMPRLDFVLIQAERGDYLQSEFSALPVGSGVVIDSLVVRREVRTTYEVGIGLEVHWRWAERGRDSTFPAVRRVQFLDSLPLPFQYAPVGAIVRVVAKIDSLWACNEGRCQLVPAPKVVYYLRSAICALGCEQADSASIVQAARNRFRSTGMALGLKNASMERPLSRGVWKLTTGEERLAGVCEKLPGNLANWIAQDQATFQVTVIQDRSLEKRILPWSVVYPTGPVQYVYDRTNIPSAKILEGAGPRLVNDTLVKYGRSLSLTGSNKRVCGRVVDDSAVVRDSWFVVPDNGSDEAIEVAMSPSFCGPRNSAWRMTGDTVWLGGTRWPILVRDLLGTSRSLPRDQASSGVDAPGLVGSRLRIPFDASVAARDPSGRRLGRLSVLPRGEHLVDLAGHRGVFLLEIRSLDGRVSQVLRGTTFAR